MRIVKGGSGLKKLAVKIKQLIRNPIVTMVIGLLMVICGLFEAIETTFEKFLGFNIGAHHGIILFGSIQVLYALLLMVEGLENIGVAAEESELEREIEEVRERK